MLMNMSCDYQCLYPPVCVPTLAHGLLGRSHWACRPALNQNYSGHDPHAHHSMVDFACILNLLHKANNNMAMYIVKVLYF